MSAILLDATRVRDEQSGLIPTTTKRPPETEIEFDFPVVRAQQPQ